MEDQSFGRSPDGSGDDLLKQMSKNDPTFPVTQGKKRKNKGHNKKERYQYKNNI